MSLVPNRAIEGAAGNQGYNLQRSLRFRSSASAYLSRTPASAGNRKIWTWSGWVKRGTLGTSNRIFAADDGSASTDQDYNTLFFTSADKIQFSGGLTNFRITTSVYRDPSAWYHIVFVTDTTQATAGNRFKLYVNGTEVTAFDTSNNPAQNTDLAVNAAIGHYHAAIASPVVNYFDGYLAEVNFIDGQALTPSSFGETSTETGVWVPKKYTGTYGTNGFYLNFSDNTSATTLAYDKSGNGNNWTANNISTTAGATYDSMTDVPTLTSATAANYCVPNPLQNGGSVTFADGNLNVSKSSAAYRTVYGSMAVSSGKWYWETLWTACGANDACYVGIETNQNTALTSGLGNTATSYVYNNNKSAANGLKQNNGVTASYGATWTANDIIGVALDLDAGTLTFYKNGTSQGTAYTGISGTFSPAYTFYNINDAFSANFGQRPFSYTPPTGFKALNTFNLPDPTIKKPNLYMDATTYTGAGGTQSITNAGSFQPDLVWMKCRNVAGTGNILQDSVRGATKGLESQTTGAEFTDATTLTSFNSNGFTVGGNSQTNGNGNTFVGWQWKKGATPGFDIVTYTGTGVARTVSHSLGVKPAMMILKNRSTAGTSWKIYHSTLGATKILLLDSTSEALTSSSDWNNTEPTSSVFTVGTNAGTNENTKNIVAYLFAEIAGFSKFGSYTGNGSADGPFVYCGFRPKYVMIKVSSGTTESWTINDAARNTYNVTDSILYPNLSDAEGVGSGAYIDFTSNGFKIRNSNPRNNGSGYTYIYAAFAENPMKYSLAR